MAGRHFEGRVAVVTGAGRGLGFEYARLLAAKGARVVINDNGSAVDGSGGDGSIAHDAARAIVAAGGEAIACTESIATAEGGSAVIEAALDTWGRMDILINSAGNSRFANLDTVTMVEFRSLIDVHLLGVFHVVRAAFPHMCRAGYGRVVLTGSIGGLYTMPGTASYALAKSGTSGLNNAIAIEGAAFGVKSNMILPGAVTRMSDGLDISAFPLMTPEMVAPVVGYLAHEDCTVTAEMLVAVAGRVARAYVVETRGLYKPDWTIDTVAENIAAIRDPAQTFTFHPAEDGFTEHLRQSFQMARLGG